MNPVITGRDKNCVMNPRRANPASTNAIPVTMIIAAASAAYDDGSLGCTPLTAENTRTADADVPATTRWRLLPKIAYRPSDASSVYSPACGGNPARLAYAIISGTSNPQMVKPAMTSPPSHERS